MSKDKNLHDIIKKIKEVEIPKCIKTLTESSDLLKNGDKTLPGYSDLETNFNNINQSCTALIDMKNSLEDFLNNQTPENKKNFLNSRKVFNEKLAVVGIDIAVQNQEMQLKEEERKKKEKEEKEEQEKQELLGELNELEQKELLKEIDELEIKNLEDKLKIIKAEAEAEEKAKAEETTNPDNLDVSSSIYDQNNKDNNENLENLTDICKMLPNFEIKDAPKGIENPNNKCFANACLQLLLHNKRFCYKIMQYKDKNELFANFTKLINSYYNDDENAILPVTSYDFLAQTCDLITITDQQQEDANELFGQIISVFGEDNNKIGENDKLISILDHIYGCLVNYDVYDYDGSPIQNDKTEIVPQIQLNIPLNKQNIQYKDLIDESAVEITKGSPNALKNIKNLIKGFNSSGSNIDLTQIEDNDFKECLTRIKLPKYSTLKKDLIICLKRFTYDFKTSPPSVIKIETPIEMSFEIGDFVLKGFIYHSGTIGSGGHYTYYGKYDDKWYLLDDNVKTEISDVDEIKVKKNTGYYYYYEKNNKNNQVLIEKQVDPTKLNTHLLCGNFAKTKDNSPRLVTIVTDLGDSIPEESTNFDVYDYKDNQTKKIQGTELLQPSKEEIKQFMVDNIDVVEANLTKLIKRNDLKQNGGIKSIIKTKLKNKTKKYKSEHKSEHKKKKKQYTVNKKLSKNPKNNSIKKHLKNKSR